MSRCPSGCPNAPEPPHIHCDLCGQEIYQEDYYYYIDGFDICEDCLEKEYRKVYYDQNEKDSDF